MTTTIILTVLVTTIAIATWQAIAWRLWRSATKQIKIAVITTGQRIVIPMRRNGEQLSPAERVTALDAATRLAHDLLGVWRRSLLRLALGRWNLCPWIESEIESAILRLKQSELLPSSTAAMRARNPMLDTALGLLPTLITTYTNWLSTRNAVEPSEYPKPSCCPDTTYPASDAQDDVNPQPQPAAS